MKSKYESLKELEKVITELEVQVNYYYN